MDQSDSFVTTMAGLQAGEPEAATEVFERFARRLIGLARLRIANRLPHKLVPEDVLPSVFRRFLPLSVR